MIKLLKFTKYLLITIILLVTCLIFATVIFEKLSFSTTQIKYGVSFSPNYARYLKLDWKKTYLQILDELKVKHLRLPSFWDTIQKDPNKDDFSEVDFMLSEAEKRGAQVILVLGGRQPRWPECHIPAWAKRLPLIERQQKTLDFVKKVVERYKDRGVISAWQVENEPFVSWFGESCDPPDQDFLKKEIELVKRLDQNRLVIVTDSGEWSLWKDAMKMSDILGISLYRKAYNPFFGYTTYPLPTFFYSLKSTLVRKIYALQNQKTIIAELQAEPWTQKAIPDTSLEEQTKLFTINDLKNNINYAQKTGFDEIYLWGAEWWFWADKMGYPQYLEYAKTLF